MESKHIILKNIEKYFTTECSSNKGMNVQAMYIFLNSAKYLWRFIEDTFSVIWFNVFKKYWLQSTHTCGIVLQRSLFNTIMWNRSGHRGYSVYLQHNSWIKERRGGKGEKRGQQIMQEMQIIKYESNTQ